MGHFIFMLIAGNGLDKLSRQIYMISRIYSNAFVRKMKF